MKQFRLKVDSRLAPERLIAEVAKTLDEFIDSQEEEGWRVDQRASRFITIGREVRPGRLRRMFQILEVMAGRTGRLGMGMGMGFGFGYGHRYAPPAVPDAPRARHDFLAAQAFPAARGSELEVKGTGREARELARDLIRRTQGERSAVPPETPRFD